MPEPLALEVLTTLPWNLLYWLVSRLMASAFAPEEFRVLNHMSLLLESVLK